MQLVCYCQHGCFYIVSLHLAHAASDICIRVDFYKDGSSMLHVTALLQTLAAEIRQSISCAGRVAASTRTD